jgi:hypothetical protein
VLILSQSKESPGPRGPGLSCLAKSRSAKAGLDVLREEDLGLRRLIGRERDIMLPPAKPVGSAASMWIMATR